MNINNIDDVKRDSIKGMLVFGIMGLLSILICNFHILEKFISNAMSSFFIQLVVVDIAVLALVCIICVIYKFWLFLNCLRIKKYMVKNDIDYYQNIIWWNNRNCFLLQDVVIICNFKICSFKYDEIESIERIYSRTPKHSNITYYSNFYLSNDVKYTVFMHTSSGFKYRNITDISDIVKDKNPSIVIKEERRFDSFRDSNI